MKTKKRKVLSLLLAFILGIGLSLGIGTPVAAAADDVAPYDPASIQIPFTKTWDDHANMDEARPASITVKLYRFKEGESYDPDQPFMTATVTGGNTDSTWTHSFVLEDDAAGNAAVYKEGKTWKTYQFVVVEDAIENYTEVEAEHKDPEVKMEVNTGEWDRHEPNNELEMDITTVGATKNYIAIHATKGQYYVWTPEKLSLLEQHAIEEFCETKPGYGGETWGKTTFLTGYGYHAEVGFTVSEDHIKFNEHSDWAMWACGEYTRSTAEMNACGITNRHVPVTDVTVTKVWDDADNQDGKRPTADAFKASLILKAGNTDVTSKYADNLTVTVDPSDPNKYNVKWTGVERYDGETEITYTVEETAITGYEATGSPAQNNGTITNKHVPETTEITVTKVWDDADDQDGIRLSADRFKALLVLKADGEDVTAKYANNLTVTADPTAANKFTVKWTGVDKFKAGTEIKYTVEEKAITGYQATGSPAQNNGTITNTHVPETTDITVTKVWDDVDNQDGIRPTADEFKEILVLKADGEDVTSKYADNLTVTADSSDPNKYIVKWTGIDKNKAGTEIEYTVEEKEITNYETTGSPAQNNGTITNKHVPETTDITVTKVWDDADDQDGIRPTADEFKALLVLKAGSEDVTAKYADNLTVTADPSDPNKFIVKWTGVDKYKGGEEIAYTVEEAAIEGYEATGNSAENNGTITNKHEPEKINISVIKVWNDSNDKDGIRPESVEVRLIGDGVETEMTLTLNEASSWSGTWEGVPKYNGGKEITYTVEETPIDGLITNVDGEGTYAVDVTGDVEQGFTVTNTHTPKEETVTPPRTGEDHRLLLMTAFAAVSLCGICALIAVRRRRTER